MKKILVILTIVPIILTGCWDQKIYEQIGFILQVSVESSEKADELRLAFTSPVVGGKEDKIEVLQTTSGIVRGGRENVRRTSPRSLEGGKVQQVLFSEEIAKRGIHDIFEILQRDPSNPALAWIVVVEGSPAEMLEKSSKFEDKPRSAIYINQLLEGNARSSYIPETRAYDFDILYFAPGIDPMTPLLKLGDTEIKVVGSALFSGDKMVGKVDHKQTAILLAMRNMMRLTEYICMIPDFMKDSGENERHIAVMLKGGKKTKIKIKIIDDKPEVNISLSYTSTLDSFKWDRTGDPAVQKKIEEHLAEHIKRDSMETLKYLQEIGSDPIGIGDMIRARYNSYWKSVDWKEAYKDIEFNVDVKVEIMQFGVIQ